MATFDISRVAFDPRKHYTSVRMQQGRVLMDDDWNENERIEDEEKRRTQVDVIGPYGTPDDGFKVENVRTAGGVIDFDIHEGTMYLGGLRLEMDVKETFRLQRDWLQKKDADFKEPPAAGLPKYDLVFLTAWQQPVSAVEDTSLLEAGLGGPDTTTRVRNMRTVGLKAIIETDCASAWDAFVKGNGITDEYELPQRGILQVTIDNNKPNNDQCSPPILGQYLGAENQAIRVQVTRPGFFTWGFDNAAPLYRVAVAADNKTCTMITAPKDQYHWPLTGQVVEILPWSAVLPNYEKISENAGALKKVLRSFDPTDKTFVLDTPLVTGFGAEWLNRTDNATLAEKQGNYFFMRVWNRGADTSTPEIPFVVNVAQPLGNTGLLLKFTSTPAVGEFWVIGARPETEKPIVPWELKDGISPHGLRRFVAPLAIIRWSLGVDSQVIGEVISDCRKKFPPLTEIKCTCVTAVPGPNWQRILEQFKDGQDICVCFKNGTYELDRTITLMNKGNIKFTGCGKGSHIIVNNAEAAFLFSECRNIVIRDLSITSKRIGHAEKPPIGTKTLGGALSIKDCENVLLEDIYVECAGDLEYPWRQSSCVKIFRDMVNPPQSPNPPKTTTVCIRHSHFTVGPRQTGLLILNSVRTIIEGNTVRATGTKVSEVANQGIVIGGMVSSDVNVTHNFVTGVIQGIHAGFSMDDKQLTQWPPGKPDRMRNSSIIVNISNNTVLCYVPWHYKKERHGIFVGNNRSLQLCSNTIVLKLIHRGEPAKERGIKPRVNGIRVYGHFGKKLIIRDNHLHGFDYAFPQLKNRKPTRNIGILICYLSTPTSPKWWIAEANITGILSIRGKGRPFRTSKMIHADRCIHRP